MGKYAVAGLSRKEVERSRAKYGSNELKPPQVESFWDKLKENFEDPLIKILCVALGITLVLAYFGYAEWYEGIGIAFAVFIATFVSTWSEFKNEESFRDLQEKASKIQNTVFRNGPHLVKIFASEIVAGDYVLLQAGDKVPADGKLVFGEVYANQVSLTGENDPVKKIVAPSGYKADNPKDLADAYLLFRGSVIDEGEGVMLVDKVGVNTFYGQLSEELTEKEERESPLQVKLSKLADQISMFGYLGATFIAISFLFKQFVMDQGWEWVRIVAYAKNWEIALHDSITALILAIIVIVVAVPEGLPMMIAIVLSLNMRKLLKCNVLVRRLLGIETAGSLTILFADKTGTITKGRFQPQVFVSGAVESYHSCRDIPEPLRKVLAFTLRESTSSVIDPDGSVVGGNSSDQALLAFLDKDSLLEKSDVKVEREILFSSAHKFSASQVHGRDVPRCMIDHAASDSEEAYVTLIKGAAENILQACDHYYTEDGARARLDSLAGVMAEVDRLSSQAVRVIVVATSDEPLEDSSEEEGFIVHEPVLPGSMTLVGIVGVLDEVRPESAGALSLAKQAGIQVVMITGDRKETAVSVAKQIGLLDDPEAEVLTSDQLQSMSDHKVQEMLPRISVIARALPTDKSRLVRLAQELDMVAGMTGDGVNDSSALKKADVGFAMGAGSEVAKEAADIVILDNNLRSITQAVLYGRTIFKSIRKFIVFQSTINVTAMAIAFSGPFIGYDFPLTLIQLLWVNLVMDTLAAIAFGGEPALSSYMKEHPIKRDQHIISPSMWSAILINGAFITLLSHVFLTSDWVADYFVRDGQPNYDVFLSAFFSFFIFMANFNAFNVRTPRINIFHSLLRNSGFVMVVTGIFLVQIVFTWIGGSILRTVPLTLNEWLTIIAASSIIIPFDMLRKALLKPFLGSQTAY